MLIAIDLEFNELDILFALLHYPCKSKTWSKWDPMTIGGTPKFVDFTSVIVHPPRDIVIIWNIYCKLNKQWNLNDIMIFQYKFWTQDHLRKIIKIPLLSLIFDQLNFAFSFQRSMFSPSSILSILLEVLEENFNLVIHFEYLLQIFPLRHPFWVFCCKFSHLVIHFEQRASVWWMLPWPPEQILPPWYVSLSWGHI